MTALFISHGGGPLPILGDPGHQQMVACLKDIGSTLRKPEAIVLISAHWEEQQATITAGKNPTLIYDYYNFPGQAYEIKYPCPGQPWLAEDIDAQLQKSNILSSLDPHRGFDHGLFIPLKIMYPEADIPCVQLSLLNSLNPKAHIDLGKALQSLLHKNILIIGSGFSFHNLPAFFQSETPEQKRLNYEFDSWLVHACSNKSINEEEREKLLEHWELAPGARYCHPREEHLLPLHVCYGATQKAASKVIELEIMNKKASMFLWN